MSSSLITKGSDLKYPSSAWSSSVNDVYSGLASTSVSSFWVTSERLELTPFTTFANLDKIYLWVPRPSVENDFLSNIQKVLLPFSLNCGVCSLYPLPLCRSYLFGLPQKKVLYENGGKRFGQMGGAKVVLPRGQEFCSNLA